MWGEASSFNRSHVLTQLRPPCGPEARAYFSSLWPIQVHRVLPALRRATCVVSCSAVADLKLSNFWISKSPTFSFFSDFCRLYSQLCLKHLYVCQIKKGVGWGIQQHGSQCSHSLQGLTPLKLFWVIYTFPHFIHFLSFTSLSLSTYTHPESYKYTYMLSVLTIHKFHIYPLAKMYL